ncbi:VanW family protein [Patescibacteria group bacterium]
MRKLIVDLGEFIKNHAKVFEVLFGVFGAVIFVVVVYNFALMSRILPNVYVNDINVGLLNTSDAIDKISISAPNVLELKQDELIYELNLNEIGFAYDFSDTISKSYSFGRAGDLSDDFLYKVKAIYTPSKSLYSIKYDENLLSEYLSVIAGQIVEDPVLPTINKTDKVMVVTPGSPGTEIDLDQLNESIIKRLESGDFKDIHIFTKSTPVLSEEEVLELQTQSNQLVGKLLVTKLKDQIVEFTDIQLAQSLLPQNNEGFLTDQITKEINRAPQNAILVFEGDKVKEFTPALDGLAVVENELSAELSSAMNQLMNSDLVEIEIEIPVVSTTPEVTNDSVNDLGINELLGRGSSAFVGSIASRIHNIGVASASFNGVLIEPGEVFSFNATAGDISSLTGYKQAYIIKDGATVLGDGGGVCQVSTTLFRAALDAGLPIVERSPHSYRVTYYEQGSPPGIDATIYSPTTDLKFKNDTPAHLLVQSYYDPTLKTLDFEIYGTSDGRVSTISNPVVTSVIPPPEDLYIDDPNLKEGEIEQIDWKAWGAKANFTYKVERDGEVVFEKTYYSNYRPWQAKFLRGTAPIN